jgi:hypothetical protein
MIALYAVVAVLLVISIGCLRIGEWHSREAMFWRRVDLVVQLDPSLDDHYRALLAWAREHPPALPRKLLTWRSPTDRRAARDGVQVS